MKLSKCLSDYFNIWSSHCDLCKYLKKKKRQHSVPRPHGSTFPYSHIKSCVNSSTSTPGALTSTKPLIPADFPIHVVRVCFSRRACWLKAHQDHPDQLWVYWFNPRHYSFTIAFTNKSTDFVSFFFLGSPRSLGPTRTPRYFRRSWREGKVTIDFLAN